MQTIAFVEGLLKRKHATLTIHLPQYLLSKFMLNMLSPRICYLCWQGNVWKIDSEAAN